jgi:4'-phosphopantetheinyl transferase
MRENEVHVLRVDLNGLGPMVSALTTILSPDERERADRFRFAIHKRRFILTRGLLRIVLGVCLNRRPGDLRFTYGEYGKPDLLRAGATRQLAFNVSHSEDLAVFALTAGTEVGVDVELLRPREDLDALARTAFSPAEFDSYGRFTPAERPRAFYRCWTRKEAFIKAIGHGFAYPLDQFDVSMGECAALLRLNGEATAATRWWLQNLATPDPFIGALAIPDINFHLSEFDLLPEMCTALVEQTIAGGQPEAPVLSRMESRQDCSK